jgi:hypothetical protein|tara:strand:- start:740 stop:1039 length:300 start_codon:yes stop_codon:yes gene_type:complete
MKKEQLKRISRHTEQLLVEWIKTLLPEAEAEKVSLDNLKNLLPTENHALTPQGLRLVPNSPKWIRQGLKKMVKENPELVIESVTLEQLQWKAKSLRSLS